MHLDHYAHPEFGWLSPVPRLRRELRTAFLAGLFGIGIGAAGVIALNGYANVHDEPTSHKVSWQDPPAVVVAGDNTLQTARIEDEHHTAPRLMPISRTAKPTLQPHARIIIRLVPTFALSLGSCAECECLQQTTPQPLAKSRSVTQMHPPG